MQRIREEKKKSSFFWAVTFARNWMMAYCQYVNMWGLGFKVHMCVNVHGSEYTSIHTACLGKADLELLVVSVELIIICLSEYKTVCLFKASTWLLSPEKHEQERFFLGFSVRGVTTDLTKKRMQDMATSHLMRLHVTNRLPDLRPLYDEKAHLSAPAGNKCLHQGAFDVHISTSLLMNANWSATIMVNGFLIWRGTPLFTLFNLPASLQRAHRHGYPKEFCSFSNYLVKMEISHPEWAVRNGWKIWEHSELSFCQVRPPTETDTETSLTSSESVVFKSAAVHRKRVWLALNIGYCGCDF